MISIFSNPIDTAIYPASRQPQLTELVRGNEQEFLGRFSPLVRRQSLTLDLSSVQRIDAAGITALISLHVSAHAAGHRFTVANPTPRVAEILTLVGLERILLSHYTVRKSHSGLQFERPAA